MSALSVPDIDQKVAFLARGEAYPEAPKKVEVRETHMSWVFLLEERVYKLKKPFKRDLIDFSTADARYRNCHEEVRLNRRLAPQVYLGVEQLSLTRDGELELGGNGMAVDWLVVMRRLPEEAMLESQIDRGEVNYDRVRQVAAKLAKFYRDAAPVLMSAEQYRSRLQQDLDRTHAVLADYDVPESRRQPLLTRQKAFLQNNTDLLAQRAGDGHIVEAHGDLRPEHVCLTDPPVVIDCLEFSRDLRIQDSVDELAFLALECRRLGDDRAGKLLFDTYAEVSGDRPSRRLVAFYQSYRACIRAKLAVWHLDDDPNEERGAWREKAARYLELALADSEEFDG